MQATSAFLLWATAAKACGPSSPGSACSTSSPSITSWDGGGLHAETNPGENMPPECGMVLKLDGHVLGPGLPRGGGRVDCDPDGTVQLTGRVVDQAELDENRISTKYQ